MMKKMYETPSFQLAWMELGRNFCASVNVGSVTTGTNDGLEGWTTDPDVGDWE